MLSSIFSKLVSVVALLLLVTVLEELLLLVNSEDWDRLFSVFPLANSSLIRAQPQSTNKKIKPVMSKRIFSLLFLLICCQYIMNSCYLFCRNCLIRDSILNQFLSDHLVMNNCWLFHQFLRMKNKIGNG